MSWRVARAFRSDAIVSLQFRPLLPTWTFTVIARADTKRSDGYGGRILCCPNSSMDGRLYFSATSPPPQVSPAQPGET